MPGFVTGVGRIVQEIYLRNGYGRMFYESLYPQCSFLWYHGCVRRNRGPVADTEIGLVIFGRIRKSYYVLLIHLSRPIG